MKELIITCDHCKKRIEGAYKSVVVYKELPADIQFLVTARNPYEEHEYEPPKEWHICLDCAAALEALA